MQRKGIGLTGLNPLSILFKIYLKFIKIYAIKFELLTIVLYIIIVKQNKLFC